MVGRLSRALPVSDPVSFADTGAVVVAHDRIDYAAACIRSLRRHLLPSNIALVLNVPDRLDTPRIGELCEALVVSPQTPQGYGANLNLGVRSLSPDLTFVVLANDDVDFVGDGLARLIAHLRKDESIGVAGPALRDVSGAPLTSARPFPDALYALLRSAVPSRPMAPLERISHRRWHKGHRPIADMEKKCGTEHMEDVDWVVGAVMAVRRAAFNDVGGFDEDFFLYFEETDFCYRLWRRGWKVVHAPDAAVVHLQGRSTTDTRYHRMLDEGQRRFLVKRLGHTRWVIFESILLAAFVATAIWSLAGGCLHPATLRERWFVVQSRWRIRIFLRRA